MEKSFTLEEIGRICRNFILNSSGKDVMEVKEVKRGLEDINVNVTEEQIQQLTRSMNANGSDGLNTKDFGRFMNLALERGVIAHDDACPKNLQVSLADNHQYFLTNHTTQGLQIHFNKDDLFQNALLDHVITDGIYQWCLEFHYEVRPKNRPSVFMIGGGPSKFLNDRGVYRFQRKESGMAFLRFFRTFKMELGSLLDNVKDSELIPHNETKVVDESCVTVEADGGAHTLSFIVNYKRVPRAISNMPLSICLGVGGWGSKSTATSLFFRRVAAPTPAPFGGTMTYHKYIPESGGGCCTIL